MPAGESVSLHLATPADAELIFSYMKQLRQDDPMPRYEFAGESAVKKSLEDLIHGLSLGRIWLIRDGEQAVGYTAMVFFHSLEFAGRCALLDEFFVDPNHRRRGIGKAALKWICESAAVDLEIRGLFLELSPDNVAAAGLYGSMGFKQRRYRMMVRSIAFD